MKTRTKLLSIVIIFLIWTSALSILPHQAKSAGSGPVEYYKFDEGSGKIAHDSSGNRNDGTVYGAAWTRAEILGNVLSFSRESFQYVEAPAIPNLNSFTVVAWVKFKSQNFEHIVATRSSNYPYQFDLWMGATGYKLRLGVYLTSGQVFMTDSDPGTPLVTGVWYFVAGVFDGENIYAYLNGTLDYSKSASGSLYSISPNVIVGGAGYDSNYFDGTIAGVQIYNRALTAEEIWDIYSPPGVQVWMQWWFWAIIVLGILAILLISTTLYYRSTALYYRRKALAKETNSMPSKPKSKEYIICPSCGANMPADARYCGKCGTSLQ